MNLKKWKAIRLAKAIVVLAGLSIVIAACEQAPTEESQQNNQQNNQQTPPAITSTPIYSKTAPGQGETITITVPVNSGVGLVQIYAHQATNPTATNYIIADSTPNVVSTSPQFTVDVPLLPGDWQFDYIIFSNAGLDAVLYHDDGSGTYQTALNCSAINMSLFNNSAQSCTFSAGSVATQTVTVQSLTYNAAPDAGDIAITAAGGELAAGYPELTHTPAVTYIQGTTATDAGAGEVVKLTARVDADVIGGNAYFTLYRPDGSSIGMSTINQPYELAGGVFTQYLKLPADFPPGYYIVGIEFPDPDPVTAKHNGYTPEPNTFYMSDIAANIPGYLSALPLSYTGNTQLIEGQVTILQTIGQSPPTCTVSMNPATVLTGANIASVDGDGIPEIFSITGNATVSLAADNCIAVTVTVDTDTEFVKATLYGILGTHTGQSTIIYKYKYSEAWSTVARGTQQDITLYLPLDDFLLSTTPGSFYLEFSMIGGDTPAGTQPVVWSTNRYGSFNAGAPDNGTSTVLYKILSGAATNNNTGNTIGIVTVNP